MYAWVYFILLSLGLSLMRVELNARRFCSDLRCRTCQAPETVQGLRRGESRVQRDQIQPDSKSVELVVALAGKSMNDIYHTKASKEKADSNYSGWVSDFILS